MRLGMTFALAAIVLSVAFGLLWTSLNHVMEHGNHVWSFPAAGAVAVIVITVNFTARAVTRMEGDHQ